MDQNSNWSEGEARNKGATKFAQIAQEAEKQGATLTGGFYSKLDKLSSNYTRRVTIPKNPRTYYIGEDVKHRPSVIYLEALNAKRREAELEAQAEEIQREFRRQKKAEERRKKREAAEKLKREREEELQKAIDEEREREDSTRTNGAFKAYSGDRFGTRGDYSEGMLYLSRITAASGTGGKLKHISMKDGLFSHMRKMHDEHRRALLLQQHRAGANDHHLMNQHAENGSDISSDAFSDVESTISGEDIPIGDDDELDDAFALGHNLESKRKCAKALASMSQNPAIREAVVKGGAIAAVVRLAKVPDERIRLDCARSMCTLSVAKGNHEKMFDDDAVTSLCKLLGSAIQETTYVASVTLANLATRQGHESDIIASGVLGELSAIRHHHPHTVTQYARLVLHLCCSEDSINGLHEIVESIFTLANAHDESIRDFCLRAIACLVMVPQNRLLLSSCGTSRLIADMLRFDDDDKSLRTYSIIVFALSCNEKSLSKLVEHGAIDLALDLALKCGSSSKDYLSASYAVGALANMGRYESCLDSMFERGVIKAMVDYCTAPEEEFGEYSGPMRHACARVLYSMVNDEENATKAVKGGAMKALVGLCLPSSGASSQEGESGSKTDEVDEVRRSSGLALAKLLARCNTSSIPAEDLNPGTSSLIKLMAYLAAEEETAENDPTHPKHQQALDGELDAEMTSACADAICNLAAQQECRGMLVAQGAVQTLTFLVKSGSEKTIDKCAQALYYFSAQKENHVGMFDGGVVETAITVMHFQPGPKVVRLCGAMLFTLAGDKDARSKIIAHDGALDELLKMSMSRNQQVRILCGAVLCRLSNDIERSEQIIKAGAIPSLMRLAHWTHHQTRQRCIVAISNLARGKLRARIIDEGAVPVLIALSSSKDKKMRQDCAAALCNMSCSGVGTSELKMAEQGAIAALIVLGLVRSADEPVTRKTCAQGIFNLLSNAKNLNRAINEDVLWALNEVSSMDEDTQEMLAVAACNLSRDNRGRTKLLAGPISTLMDMISNEKYSTDVRVAAGLAIQNLTCSCSTAEVARIASEPRLVVSLSALATTIDDAMVKLSCAASLCAISLNADCRTAFLQGGGVKAMTRLASLGSTQMNNYCSATLYALASGGANSGRRNTHDRHSSALARECVRCGAMTLVVQLSACKHLPTKEHCARTLYMLSLVKENLADIVYQEGVRCVVAMCILEGATSPLIQGICARTLCLLSCHKEVAVRSKMVQDGAVRVVSFLAEKIHDKRVRKDCVLTLCNLSFGTNSSQMTTDGATHTLCELCDLRVLINMERISVVFRNLASHQGNVRRMVGAGVVPTLVAIASKGNFETKLHCLIGLCLISFESTVRLAMAEEGAIPTIMELSRYIGTRAAVHYCGMAISNIAAEPKAQAILVKAGAISTLMDWMDHQTDSSSGDGDGEKQKRKKKRQDEDSEEELMRKARQRAKIPPVEPDELEPLSERFEEPRVKFEERSLPWRKFHIQLKVVEPEPPPMPAITRPSMIVKSKKKKRRASTPGVGEKKKKLNKGEEEKQRRKNEGANEAAALITKQQENPQDIENDKILEQLKDEIMKVCKPTVCVADEDVVDELKEKDLVSWARRNDFALSKQAENMQTQAGHNDGKGIDSQEMQEIGDALESGDAGFENLFASMRSGSMPIMDPPKSPLVSSTKRSNTDKSGSSKFPEEPEESPTSPTSPTSPEVMESPNRNQELDVFSDFEDTMQGVSQARSSIRESSADFGNEDFMQHLDNIIAKF